MSVTVHPGRLREALARRGWSASDLAREAGLSAPTIGSALAGKPITARSLRLMAQALAKAPALDGISELLMLDARDSGLE